MRSKLSSASDESLLSLILAQRADWRDLMSELLRRHHESLLIRCRMYLRNQQDAEDATQETELRAFRAIQGFRQDASFRTWLFAIADRQCYDLARRRERNLLSDQIRALIEIHQQDLNYRAESSDSRDLVGQVMHRLPRHEREVLMLRFFLDLSLQDMAHYLGLGLSATKMRLYRALDLFDANFKAEQRA